MKKKTLLGLTLILSFLFLTTGNAFALWEDYADFYMTSSNGTYDVRATYGLDEKPYLYIRFTGAQGQVYAISSSTTSNWQWLDTAPMVKVTPGSTNEIWITFSDSYFQSHIVAPPSGPSKWNAGDTWQVSASSWLTPQGSPCEYHTNTATTGFTVTPEPVSAILFLTGGAALVYRRRYRRK